MEAYDKYKHNPLTRTTLEASGNAVSQYHEGDISLSWTVTKKSIYLHGYVGDDKIFYYTPRSQSIVPENSAPNRQCIRLSDDDVIYYSNLDPSEASVYREHEDLKYQASIIAQKLADAEKELAALEKIVKETH